MKKVLIKNGTIVTATDEFKGDLLLADGKIAAIGGAIDGIDRDAVDFVPNYDNTMTEPLLLPTKYMMPKESM